MGVGYEVTQVCFIINRNFEFLPLLSETEVKDLMVMSSKEVKKQLQEEVKDKSCDQSHDSSNALPQETELGQAEDVKPPGI